jgi:hypothetical protein
MFVSRVCSTSAFLVQSPPILLENYARQRGLDLGKLWANTPARARHARCTVEDEFCSFIKKRRGEEDAKKRREKKLKSYARLCVLCVSAFF